MNKFILIWLIAVLGVYCINADDAEEISPEGDPIIKIDPVEESPGPKDSPVPPFPIHTGPFILPIQPGIDLPTDPVETSLTWWFSEWPKPIVDYPAPPVYEVLDETVALEPDGVPPAPPVIPPGTQD